MIPQEALRHFEEQLCKHCCEWDKSLRHCNTCPTDTAKKSLQKQIPKKPVLEKTKGIVGIDMWHCPVCDGEIISDWNRDIANPYCHLCGQRLDWSKPKGDSYDFAIIDEVIAYDTQKKD